MLSNEAEENPLAALIKKVEEEGMKGKDNDDPIIVFDDPKDNNKNENQDNGRITLSIRQPSFSHLTNENLVLKGANESITRSNQKLRSKDSKSKSEKKHSSSYANVKIAIDPKLKNEIREMQKSNNFSKVENGSNSILVLTGNNDNEDEENDKNNVPIGLSIRQPSFASLCDHIIPKGGLETGKMPIVIEEVPSSAESNSKQNDEDIDDDSMAPLIGLQVRQSSYANLHIVQPLKEEVSDLMKLAIKEEDPQQSKKQNETKPTEHNISANNSNQIIVLTGNNENPDEEDESGVPIGLSVRQPSFASLCNHIIPKGGLESGEIPIVIEEEPEKNEDLIQKEGDDLLPALGLQVRQSSYANLHLAQPPKEEEIPDLLALAIEEEVPQQTKKTVNQNDHINQNDSNPIIVLTGNDENADDDDESGAPIGLSVRQPSFASLCNHIIPKGGLESGEMPIVIEEDLPPEENENFDDQIGTENYDAEIEPMVLDVRQSSYANLHFGSQPSSNVPNIEPIPDEEIEADKKHQHENEENVNKPPESEDTIIVLTDNENADDNAPIGLSVRQPSFASLTGNIIPKGGFQPDVPTITEESNEAVLDQEISDVEIGSSDNDDNEDQTNDIQTNINSNNDQDNSKNDDKKVPEMKDKILNSLLSINKEWWDEIGYKPPSNLHSVIRRNCSMFQVPPTMNFLKKTFGSSNSNDTDSNSKSSNPSIAIKRPSQSLYQGQLNTIDDLLKDDDDDDNQKSAKSSNRGNLSKDKRGPSIYRVNSYGNKTELIEVEMPLLAGINDEEEESQIQAQNDSSFASKENEDEDEFVIDSTEEASKQSRQKGTQKVAGNKNEAVTNSPASASKSGSNQGMKMSRGPSLQRVSSFGNASTLKIVEMPSIAEEKVESGSRPSTIDESDEEGLCDGDYSDEEEEEYEEEFDPSIPPEILQMMAKPRDPIVYSALCGASINGYNRETVHKALTDLKVMNKKCQEEDLDEASEFLTRVIESIRADAARDDPFFEVEEQMRDTEVELQGKLADWQNMYEELDEEYKAQVEECEQRYQDDLLSLEKQFHSTTAKTAKVSSLPTTNEQARVATDRQNDDFVDDEAVREVKATAENGMTIVDDNPKVNTNKKRPNVITNSPANRIHHSSLSAKSSWSPTVMQPKKPQQRSKAVAPAASSSSCKTPQLFQSTSPVISPGAMKMKEKVQKMIKQQRFEESFELSLKYYKKQMEEHQKQVKKRSQAFLAAKTALKQKHEDERKEIEFNFQSKRAEFTKKREQSLVPLRQQIIQLRKMKTLIEEGEKNEKFNETMQPRLRASRTRKGRVATLVLPPLSRNSNI